MSFKRILNVTLIAIFCYYHCAANTLEYQFPESAAYDLKNDCYYISNFNGNSIVKIGKEGTITGFIHEVQRPLGMEIRGRILYAVSNPNSVKAYCLESGEETFSITIDEAIFLNDLTLDTDGFIYTSDTRSGNIFKIDPTEETYTRLCQTGFNSLNGIIFDIRHNRLVTCAFSETGDIGVFDFKENQFTKLPLTIAPNLDGITLDQDGNYYFSTWGPGSFAAGFDQTAGAILKMKNSLEGTPEIISQSHYGPADIFFNFEKMELIVPNALANTIDILKF